MTIRRGFDSSKEMKDSERGGMDTGPRTFYLKSGTETTVVLLDEVPAAVYRHRLFIKGDKKAGQMRLTCADQSSDQSAPRVCLVCNAMLRHDQIGRKPFIYLSVIDERQFTYNGKEYKDMKNLLELPKAGAEIFEKRKAAHGSLVGMRFRVFRSSKQNSDGWGDSWEKIDQVDLVTHFWYSPSIPRLIESSSRKGDRPISHEQAVGQLVMPFNYEEIMGEYKIPDAEKFVAYLTGEAGMAGAGAGSAQGHGAGSYQAPPPPPGRGGPTGAPPPPPQGQPAPNYAVPAGQVPQHAQQPAYAPPPPPRMPDPRGAAPPAQGQPYQAPAPPQGQPPQGQYQPPAPPRPAQAPPQGQPPPFQPAYAPPGAQYAPPGAPGYAPQPPPPSTQPQPYQAPPPPAGYPQQGQAPQGYAPPPPPGAQQGPPPGYGYQPPPAPPPSNLPPQAAGYNFERPAPPQAGWSSTPPGFAPPPAPPAPPAKDDGPDLPF